MDHLHHFGLTEDPFRNDHHERFLVELASQGLALRRLDRAVRQGRGLVVLVGGVGSGKTLLARRLYEELEDEVFEAGMMVVLRGNADSDWLLGRFASQLGIEAPSAERDALMAQIYERLAIIREDGRHAVFVVDDAQALAGGDTLAEMSGLSKLEYEDRRVLSIVLVGTPPLAAALAAQPDLAHHVEVQVRLPALDAGETAAYLAERIRRAEGEPGMLLPDAVSSLHAHSGGAPGLLNTLADNALFEAFLAGRTQVERADVERAHAELGWGEIGKRAAPQRAAAVSPRPAPAASEAEHTRLAAAPPAVARAPVTDLDSALDAALAGDVVAVADAGQTLLVDFDADAPPARHPVPARAGAAPTEIQLEPDDAPGAPPKQGDEVDDLFMELLED